MMRGIFRLGTIGFLIGLIFAVSAPTAAQAVTSINMSGQDIQFPDSVVGRPAIPDGGVLVPFSGRADFTTLTNPSLSPGDTGAADNGIAGTARRSDLAAAFSGSEIASQLQEAGVMQNGQNGAVQSDSGSLGENGAGSVSVGGVAAGSGSEEVVGDGETMDAGSGPSTASTAPEPATWIMMIAGFWIVAWRLRRREDEDQGMVPAQA